MNEWHMATAPNRIVNWHHGPELHFHFSTTSRLGSLAPQCRFLQVSRSNQRVYFEGPFLAWRSGATRRLHSGRRASKDGNSGGSSRNGKNAGDINEDAGADSETDEAGDVEGEIRAEKAAAQRQVSKESAGLWGDFWGKVRQNIDEANEAEADDGDSDSDQEEERIVVEMEEAVNPAEEDLPKAEPSKTGFWRRWWKVEAETPDMDRETKGEDELLVRDLENLQFRWKEFLEPTPENLLALGFSALLGLAGLQILWQMVVVATAITLSAVKYTVLAAIIVGLLIFLL